MKTKSFMKTRKKPKVSLIALSILLIGVAIVFTILHLTNNSTTKHKITFSTNGGSYVEALTVDADGKIVKPEDPTKENYKFVGWYYNNELYDFDAPVTDDVKLEAVWEPLVKVSSIELSRTTMTLYVGKTSKLTATIMPKNASNKNVNWQSSSPDIVSVDEKGNIQALKEGKAVITATTEDGNYTATIEITSKLSIADDTVVETDNLKNTTYKIYFKDSDGTKLYDTQTIKYGNTVVAPEAPTKEGHIFLGWYNGRTKYSFSSNVKSNLTLTAKWEKIKYTITFVNYDGTTLQTKSVAFGSIPTYTKLTPKKDGTEKYTYKFAGWSPELSAVTQDAIYTATFVEELNTYSVKFTDEYGTSFETQKITHGNKATLPEAPTKEGHTFIGWYYNDSEYDFNTEITSNVTITAKWEKNVYTATFVNFDGTVLYTQTLEYGTTPLYMNEAPTKESDNTYTYMFSGWDKEISAIKDNTTYTAQFEPIYIDYTITFVNDDGTVLNETIYHYGDIVTLPETPTKQPTAEYSYTFNGWSPEVLTVTQNATYTATYTKALNSYNVTFVDVDGTVLAPTQTIEYGSKATMPDVPTKEGHTFLSWINGNIEFSFDSIITADLVLTAKWEKNKYTVTFVNIDGTVLDTQILEYGATPIYTGSIPTKTADMTYNYVFNNWNNEITTVTCDTTYIAQFEAVYIDYTITFVNDDGTILNETTYHYGDTVIVPTAPTKEADAMYTYTFANWTPDITKVESNKTYTATYTRTLNRFDVTFVDVDGTTLAPTQTVEYGSKVTMPDAPTKEGHTFLGWFNDNTMFSFDSNITTDLVLTAKWEKIKYIITFVNFDGTVLETKSVEYGVKPEYTGETPQKITTEDKSYTFVGWSPELSIVTQDATYTANFAETINVYNVSFVDELGNTLAPTQTVTYGNKVTEPEIISKEGYTFLGWFNGDTKFAFDSIITADLVLTAKWEKNKYTITFVNFDGTTLDTLTVEHGSKLSEPTTPEKEGYTFLGWFNENTKFAFDSVITTDLTLTARFEINKYTITFKNYDGTILDTQTVEYGTKPEYTGKTPTKAETAQFTYTFAGWSPEITVAKQNITYTATFTETLQVYEVKFIDEDESVISSQKVAYGNKVTVPATPIKEGHTFIAWYNKDKKYSFEDTVKSNLTLTAKWEISKYTITFVNYDNSVLETVVVEHGETPKYTKAEPTRPADATYSYSFDGWTPSITVATKNTTYTATFKSYIDTDKIISNIISGITSKHFKATRTDKSIDVKFTSYKQGGVTVKPPYELLDIVTEVTDLVDGFANSPYYKSVLLEYKGKTLNACDYTLDSAADWIAHVCGISGGLLGLLSADTNDLVGKTVAVKITLKDGYVTANGTANVTYSLKFSNQ